MTCCRIGDCRDHVQDSFSEEKGCYGNEDEKQEPQNASPGTSSTHRPHRL